MKKWICLLLAGLMGWGFLWPSARAETELEVTARGAILMDAGTGEVLYGHRQDVRMPIASVTKVMTLILIFEAIEEGRLDMGEELMISQSAADMGGSQVYLEAGDKHRVDELVKSIIVASANDACVAMAETLSGSEAVFVQRMNERAKELGAINTQFQNCTGLPAKDAGSCAYDVALLSRELMTHDRYFEYSRIWIDTVEHSGGRITQISNTNKLIRSYDGADGVKTGFTNEAMHCLSATAKRDDTRLIAVILGGQSSVARFSEATMLLDYGFAHYETAQICHAGDGVQTMAVEGSPVTTMDLMLGEDCSILVEKGKADQVKTELVVPEALQAPIAAGDTVGSLKVTLEGEVLREVPIIAAADAPKASFWDWWALVIRQWVPQTCN